LEPKELAERLFKGMLAVLAEVQTLAAIHDGVKVSAIGARFCRYGQNLLITYRFSDGHDHLIDNISRAFMINYPSWAEFGNSQEPRPGEEIVLSSQPSRDVG